MRIDPRWRNFTFLPSRIHQSIHNQNPTNYYKIVSNCSSYYSVHSLQFTPSTYFLYHRSFSSSHPIPPPQQTHKTSTLEDTIRKIQKEQSDSQQEQHQDPHNQQQEDTKSSKHTSFPQILLQTFQSIQKEVHQTWVELVSSSKPKDINKKLVPDSQSSSPSSSTASDENYSLMIIDPSEHLSTFERIQRRLSSTPILNRILQETTRIYQQHHPKQQILQEKIQRVTEDAREVWETSQNPWIYRLNSVYDTMTAEHETTKTERELRILDPSFSLEHWKENVVEYTLPQFMKYFLLGDIGQLQDQLSPSVYQRLWMESKVRKEEGVFIDPHVLGIMNCEILSCHPDSKIASQEEKEESSSTATSPIIVIHFMVQQINCVRKKDSVGTIVEGAEDDIRAYSYIAAFQREYDEEKKELNWKIVDFMLNGAIAYL